jgi:glycosyltransferase involved in cell wall biosynthesis
MKKVLILHSSSDLYGASKIIGIVSTLMKQKGIYPVVCVSEYGPLCDKLKQLDIECVIMPLCEIRRKYFNLFGVFNRLVVLISSVCSLNRYIKKNNINVVYSNTTAVFIGAFYSWLFKRDHIWHVHEIINEPAFLKKSLQFLMKKSKSKIIVVSEAVRENWTNNELSGQIQVIQNGIDPSEYLNVNSRLKDELKIMDDENLFVIGMIGRLNAWKGHHYFLQIATELLRINQNTSRCFRFIVAGDVFPGEEYRYELFNQQLVSNNLERVVDFLGYRRDVANILNGLDLFVLPSIKPDPFPTVILESFFSAKAVVATNHGGATEMIQDKYNGVLIPWDNPALAADIINKLLVNKKVLCEMGVNAKSKALNTYTMEKFENRLKNIIEQLQ